MANAKYDNLDKKELLSLVNKQRDQLARYETKLRDLVAAYKGLSKEKEALEASLKALSREHGDPSGVFDIGNEPDCLLTPKQELTDDTQQINTSTENQEENVIINQLKSQIATLTNSLSTLSAEKSRMEVTFQTDRKQLRSENEEKERCIKELREKLLQISKHHQAEVDDIRSQLMIERHERERERGDHGIAIRKYQKLLVEVRQSKEQCEVAYEELKNKIPALENQINQKELYEKHLRDTQNELEAMKRKLRKTEAKAKEPPPLLLSLQEEMASMKAQHQEAILQEQQRALNAEEHARNLAALHEERVANLEARLAELSHTVGSYDRLRNQDQQAILKLKEQIAQLNIDQNFKQDFSTEDEADIFKEKSDADLNMDMQHIAENILSYKKQLEELNNRSEKPINIQELLKMNDGKRMDHSICEEEFWKLKHEYEQFKQQTTAFQLNSNSEDKDSEILKLRTHVNKLNEKVRILNVQLEDTDRESKFKLEHLQQVLKSEKLRLKEESNVRESDLRGKISQLEQELHKQRERSLILLDEKDQEVKTLKSTFQLLLPENKSSLEQLYLKDQEAIGGEDVLNSLSKYGNFCSGRMGESPHMLHYAQELSRRDVEIANLRKSKYNLECCLREQHRIAATKEEQLLEEIKHLQKSVARLERYQSREGANLEYLKNVVLSFLSTSDSNSRRPMLNAIAAVLKFSEEELEKINKIQKSIYIPNVR